MTMFKDIIYTNTEAFKRTGITIKDNFLALILTILGLFLFDKLTGIIAIGVSAAFGGALSMMLLSLAMYILMLLKFSFIANLLSRVVEGETIHINSIFSGGKIYLSKLINFVFITYVFGLLLDMIFRTGAFSDPYQMDHNLLYAKLAVNFLVLFVFNASFEALYQTNRAGLGIFAYGAKFFKDNFMQWLLAAILLVAVTNYNIFIDHYIFAQIASYVIMPLIFIFRGHLFNILDNSSMRMRAFKRRME